MLNGLDLFSGIGGLTLALSPWVRPVAYCENDRYAQAVLLSRMQSGDLPTAPIWDDITTLLPSMLPRNGINIIYGGFPCQPYSTAARGRNKPDSIRQQFERIINEITPEIVFAENVSLRAMQELQIPDDYSVRILETTAASVGAPHNRRRYWLLANSNRKRKSISSVNVKVESGKTDASSFWQQETELSESLRMANGIPFVDNRLRCLGNAVVPQQAREAFVRLLKPKEAKGDE